MGLHGRSRSAGKDLCRTQRAMGLGRGADPSLCGDSAWQQITVLGHNLLKNFQLVTVATEKPRTRKRTYRYLLHSLKTIRFKLIHQPARLVKPQGYSILRFSVARSTRKWIESIEEKLKTAA